MNGTVDEFGEVDNRCVLHVGAAFQGQRLDHYLTRVGQESFHGLSRSALQRLILEGAILVNGVQVKPKYKVGVDDRVSICIPPPKSPTIIPEQIFFQILFEDADILVLSKPPDLVVHPACGHYSGTLVHGLLYHCRDLGGINGTIRPGIVHRLDKDTSGVMVVAKNDQAQFKLVQQFKEKTIEKIYWALVVGGPDADEGTIISNIGRHPIHRKKMAVLSTGGREAVTHWRVLERFAQFSLLEVRLETGRTHQIRVHLASKGHPIAGDTVYGRGKSEEKRFGIYRQCLHALRLSFSHPLSGEPCVFQAPLPSDIATTLGFLRGQNKNP